MLKTRSGNSKSDTLDTTLALALVTAEDDRHRDVIKLLLPAARQYPRSATVAGLLGRAYFELDQPQAAARWFSKATRLSPQSELASLGLFQSRLDAGQKRAALQEMQRYLQIGYSADYFEILKEMILAAPQRTAKPVKSKRPASSSGPVSTGKRLRRAS